MGYLQLKSDVMRVRTAAADMICMYNKRYGSTLLMGST